jgi:PPM family protein phosphatase
MVGVLDGLSFDSYGATGKGPRRTANQDQFLIADLGKSLLVRQTSLPKADFSRILGRPQGRLLVVADGVSGKPGGELASTVAVDTLAQYVVDIMPWFFRLDESHEDDLQEELAAAIGRCQSRVKAAARSGQGYSDIATTLTMAYVLWPRAYVVHLGDSRGYLFRARELVRITEDHTVAGELQREGALTPAQAAQSRWRNVLWKAVGVAESADPDVYRIDLQPGDGLLLCTDGLTDAVEEAAIVGAMSRDLPAADITRLLLDQSRAAGASDDVTAVVTRFV